MLEKVTMQRTQLNAAHAQLLENLRLSAFAEICRFQTIQSRNLAKKIQKPREWSITNMYFDRGN